MKLSNDHSWIRKLESTRRVYGSHMAMRLATEKEIFGKSHRFSIICLLNAQLNRIFELKNIL